MQTAKVYSQIQFKNVLFLTDFSPSAHAAEPYAAELTERYGAKLHALHVRPPIINPLTPPESWKGFEVAGEIEAQQQECEILREFGDIQPDILINEGDILQNIQTAIEECEADLVVMGTRGRSGLRKLALGSIAEEIFRVVSCPVLTVGPHATEHKEPGKFTHILFATDFDPKSVAAAYAVFLANEYETQFTLLHVVEDLKAGDLIRPSNLGPSPKHLLENLVPPDVELRCFPEYLVENGRPADKILQIARERKADLIVMGVHSTRVAGAAEHLPFATAHKVVSHAACPVLTVRAQG